MQKSFIALFGLTFATAAAVSAVPVPVSGPLAGPGDGINLRAVATVANDHSIAQALDSLALSSADADYVAEENSVATRIDFADGNWAGELTPDFDSVPASLGDRFANRFSGFLNVTTAGDYDFRAFTDDGFRLTLGGEVITQLDGDRSPGTSFSGPVSLAAGLYAIELIGWEQGGQYVNELSWLAPGATDFAVLTSDVLFTTGPTVTPDSGSTAALLAVGTAAFAALRRRVCSR